MCTNHVKTSFYVLGIKFHIISTDLLIGLHGIPYFCSGSVETREFIKH